MIERGVLTIAQNSSVDYVELAYVQCQSLRRTNPGLPYAIITDANTDSSIPCRIRQKFDKIVVLPSDLAADQDWKLMNESQMFDLTPFRETLKVEADLIFTANISHWWRALEYRDCVISQGCLDHKGRPATSRIYRSAFDANGLPDLYTGLMYWRRSIEAMELFRLVRNLQINWNDIRKELKQSGEIALDQHSSTDLVFALAAKILGPDRFTLPIDWFRMVHLKPGIMGLSGRELAWHQQVMHDSGPESFIIAGHLQINPVHYHDKSWRPEHV